MRQIIVIGSGAILVIIGIVVVTQLRTDNSGQYFARMLQADMSACVDIFDDARHPNIVRTLLSRVDSLLTGTKMSELSAVDTGTVSAATLCFLSSRIPGDMRIEDGAAYFRELARRGALNGENARKYFVEMRPRNPDFHTATALIRETEWRLLREMRHMYERPFWRRLTKLTGGKRDHSREYDQWYQLNNLRVELAHLFLDPRNESRSTEIAIKYLRAAWKDCDHDGVENLFGQLNQEADKGEFDLWTCWSERESRHPSQVQGDWF